MQITFNELPEAVAQLSSKIDKIEKLLLAKTENNNPDSDQLLTIQKAAELLSLSVATLYRLVGNGLPHSKKGKRLYFSRQELLNWVKSGKKKTNAEVLAEVDILLTKKKRG